MIDFLLSTLPLLSSLGNRTQLETSLYLKFIGWTYNSSPTSSQTVLQCCITSSSWASTHLQRTEFFYRTNQHSGRSLQFHFPYNTVLSEIKFNNFSKCPIYLARILNPDEDNIRNSQRFCFFKH